MKSDIEASYKAALQKRRQLEKEIEASDAISDEKADMLHTLSKLWIFVGNLHDAAELRRVRDGSRTCDERGCDMFGHEAGCRKDGT